MKYKYEKICFGGTFDLPIHRGQEEVIRKAFSLARYCIIGLTKDDFIRKSGKEAKEIIKEYSDRRSNLIAHLNRMGLWKRYRIVPLSGHFNRSVVKKKDYCDAIVVSIETFPKALEINEYREENGLEPLEIIQVDMVLAEDGTNISSSRIRKGEIDQDGKLLPGKL